MMKAVINYWVVGIFYCIFRRCYYGPVFLLRLDDGKYVFIWDDIKMESDKIKGNAFVAIRYNQIPRRMPFRNLKWLYMRFNK